MDECLLTAQYPYSYNCLLVMIVCFAAINVSASPVEMGKATVTVMGIVHLVAVRVSSNATRDEVWRLSNILFLSGLRYKPH
jgi:hypothetical protein